MILTAAKSQTARPRIGKVFGFYKKNTLAKPLRLTYDEIVKDLRPIAAFSAKEPITRLSTIVMKLRRATLARWLFLSANPEEFKPARLLNEGDEARQRAFVSH